MEKINEKFHNLYFSQVMTIKSRNMLWERYVARTGHLESAYNLKSENMNNYWHSSKNMQINM
jgi:hypothetical protein